MLETMPLSPSTPEKSVGIDTPENEGYIKELLERTASIEIKLDREIKERFGENFPNALREKIHRWGESFFKTGDTAVNWIEKKGNPASTIKGWTSHSLWNNRYCRYGYPWSRRTPSALLHPLETKWLN